MKRFALCSLAALVLTACQDSTEPEIGTRLRPRPSTIVTPTSAPSPPLAYVTNQFGGTVSVIATATNTVVATVVGLGNFPVDMAITPLVSFIEVDIDIKPGSDPNSINCNNEKESIAVAILTTDDFDATTVEHTTVTFEGAGETHVDKKTGVARRHEEDVDGDGDTDLVFHFRLGETDLTCDSVEGTLEGETFDGQAIRGTDAVRMIDEGGGQA